MKRLFAVISCFLLLGCTIGVDLNSPEGTVQTWVRAFNDRDVKGIYITLSKEYISANGGEEQVKADIEVMLEDARAQQVKYQMKGIGMLSPLLEDEQDAPPESNIYLVTADKEYVEDDEEKVEEVILNFKVIKEDGEYKIVDFWD